jgi:phosphoribosylaminoimidazolecarboxamide formyltransferase / IMP cyclohydrolase
MLSYVHFQYFFGGTDSLQFPFIDNVFRAARSGGKYIAAPSGSQNDQAVFDTAEQLGITFVEQSTRLFHH